MNIPRLDARIAQLKQNRDNCVCQGPKCTEIREDMTKLIGIYETLRADTIKAFQAINEIKMKSLNAIEKGCSPSVPRK